MSSYDKYKSKKTELLQENIKRPKINKYAKYLTENLTQKPNFNNTALLNKMMSYQKLNTKFSIVEDLNTPHENISTAMQSI